ncbi:lantibiotic dehydratase [Fodinicola acaciae]|uniref:lantibiotic dehydratase n=1 Tax=Fodinicola acaciae TaxID=2681555 RepID=UPI0013D53906|nr:lantibiotic dehydratase [Fodinicola acaciae]
MTAFRAGRVAYVRAAVLPARRAAVLTAQEDPHERTALTRILRAVTADPVVREAVAVSSESLAALLRQIDRGTEVSIARLRRGTYAACRYLLRMTGRPTPFGLLAGVATARFGQRTQVAMSDAHRKGCRPDGEWLSSVVSELEKRPEIRCRLRLRTNDLCRERGDRYVVPYAPLDKATDQRMSEKSVRATAAVGVALTAAKTPTTWKTLSAELATRFPDAGRARIDRLLAELVDHGLLCTELPPPPDQTDPLGHVLALLENTPAAETAALRGLAKLLDEYAAAPLGSGQATWSRAITAARELQPTTSAPIQVDLRLDASVTLPEIVAKEAEAAADALLRLSRPAGSERRLADFREAFIDRYGWDHAVPVQEVLDPERGLGPPAGYQVPAESRLPLPPAEVDTARDQLIAELVQDSLTRNESTITLNDHIIAGLEPDEPPSPPPATAELTFQLVAASGQAIDRGDFHLVCAPAAGLIAGAMFGRFSYLFDDPAGSLAEAMALDAYASSCVQLAFQPAGGRLSNLTRVPAVVDRVLSIGTFDDRALGLDDIGIVADPDRLRLVSLPDLRPLTTLAPHMLDPVRRMPNAARLLSDISTDGARTLDPWRWGAVRCLPRLPRIQYGRTVFAAARWRLPRRLSDAATDPATWDRELDRWRAAARVPDRIQARVMDHSLDLDLSVPLHRRLFADELRRKADLVVTESVADPETGFGWLDGHANEVVVPLSARHPRKRKERTTSLATVRPTVTPPGGHWLYAKIYSAQDLEILRDHLPRFLASTKSIVDSWYFLRYRDPDDHLRIRFRGTPATLNEQLLPALSGWTDELCMSGLARKLELDTYRPEVDRYGGPALFELAEQVFHADSEAVLAQLADWRDGEVLAGVNFADILRAVEPGWHHWYADVSVEHYEGMHRHVRQAVEMWTDTDTDTAFSHASRHRAASLRRYGEALRTAENPHYRSAINSLLHIHHNRLIGTDAESEARAHAVASRIAAASRGRARAGR